MTDTTDDAPKPIPGREWIEPTTGSPFLWLDALNLWVAKYQVTNADFALYRPDHDSGEFQGMPLNTPRQPVAQVSYRDGSEFADWLTARDRQTGALETDQFFRLPSHREWTRFARCGDGRVYPWGNEWPPTRGNYGDAAAKRAFADWEAIPGYDDGHPVSCPVERAGENEWGLVGVGGNCYEWTFVADGTQVELRGGSWSTNQREYLRIDNAYRREPGSRLMNFGLRLVLVS